MCFLVLTCYLFMDIHKELLCLLFYKQEATCHSRWITASGYIRLFLFETSNLSAGDKDKLNWILSYIASVYVPSFMIIHLKRKVCDGPYVTLFQRDLLLAYEKLDQNLSRVVMKYFLKHASNWLAMWKECCPSFSLDAVKDSTSLPPPQNVDITTLLLSRSARLKNFFTTDSKVAPCVSCDIDPLFWKCVENSNRSTERRIGMLRNVLQHRRVNTESSLRRTDIRLRANLCNME